MFTGGTEPTRVMWSAAGPQIVRIQAPGPMTVTDIMGRSTTLDSGTLTLTGDPTYVDGDIHTITTTAG